MTRRRLVHRFLLAVFLTFVGTAASFAATGPAASPLDSPQWERRELAVGIDFLQGNFEDLFGAPQVVRILRLNLDEPGIAVRFATSNSNTARKAPVPDFVEGTGAIAAINGGYSGGGRGGPDSTNSGIFKIAGEVQPFQRQETEEFHFVGGAALGIDADGNWHFRNRPGDRWPADWPEVQYALAGAHRLVEDGKIHPSLDTQTTAREQRHVTRRHPRTAIGLSSGRTAFLVTVDGRHSGHAEGMTLDELANFMKDLGCRDALNLDGGGSTTMWLRAAGVVNHPSDNKRFDHEGARRVFSAVVVEKDESVRGKDKAPR